MSVFGSGAILGFASRLLFGPAHFVDYIHVKPEADGSKQLTVYVRKETFSTAWRGSSKAPRLYDQYSGGKKPENVTVHRLSPLQNITDDGITIDGYRIEPVNHEGHTVMANGSVYDTQTQTFHFDRDTRIQGYRTRRPRLLSQLFMIIKSPATLVRVIGLLLLSAIIDTGVFEIGKHIGYRDAQKGELPASDLAALPEQKIPSNTRMLATTLSPLPFTLQPLHASTATYEKPSPQQLLELQRMMAQWPSPPPPQT